MAKFCALLLVPMLAYAQPVTNVPARVIQIKVAASIAANAEAMRLNMPGVVTLKGAVALPEGFDLRRSWPVLLVTSSSGGSAVQSMSAYTNTALALGWVVAAVDGPRVPWDKDDSAFAWAMISSLLDQLRASWPQSKQWPFACAGFSGGAKRAAMTAANMARQGDMVAGVFMGGCNEDRATTGMEISRPSAKFFDVPMFLSNGRRDSIAGPDAGTRVKASMEQAGFRKVRLEIYNGEHRLDTNQLRTALDWFHPNPQPTQKLPRSR